MAKRSYLEFLKYFFLLCLILIHIGWKIKLPQIFHELCSSTLWMHAEIGASLSFLKKLVTESVLKDVQQVLPFSYRLSCGQGLRNISFLNLGVQNSSTVQVSLVQPVLFCTLKCIIQ